MLFIFRYFPFADMGQTVVFIVLTVVESNKKRVLSLVYLKCDTGTVLVTFPWDCGYMDNRTNLHHP